ncbi:uncharacterized protein MKS88_000022 [Plasmodium brasilianum]|uniref:uncharacterized protein n=1 Tax=Plasmodium brasilianum TaxID=5824 RepID=UPI00350E57CF|nr:hypothetical protein MKS88_000022 [Plasmodium brasilianum]
MFLPLLICVITLYLPLVNNKKNVCTSNSRLSLQHYISNNTCKGSIKGCNRLQRKVFCRSKLHGSDTKYDKSTCNETLLDILGSKVNYIKNIQRLYEDLNKLNEREDKIKYLIRENIETCKYNYLPLTKKKKFTNKNIRAFTKEKKRFYINQVRDSVYYKYINRCNSNVYLAIDIVKKKKRKWNRKDKEGNLVNVKHLRTVGDSLHDNEEKANNDTRAEGEEEKVEASSILMDIINEHNNDNKDVQEFISKCSFSTKNRYFITIDGFSDNLVLCCFLHCILKGIQRVDLNFFLKMNIKKIADNLKNMFTIHFNTEHVVDYVYKYISNFFLSGDGAKMGNGSNSSGSIRSSGSRRSSCSRRSSGSIRSSGSNNSSSEELCRAFTPRSKVDCSISDKLKGQYEVIPSRLSNSMPIYYTLKNSMKIHPYPRIAHMLSGGVDSLMALLLLEKKKFYVDNFFLNYNNYDCSKNDLRYARSICGKRDRNLFVININEEYFKKVLIPMLRSYSEGKIPNPDIMCNKKIKYKYFLSVIRSLYKQRVTPFNYDYISTGHYAMISTNDSFNANNVFNNDFPYVYDKDEGEMEHKVKKQTGKKGKQQEKMLQKEGKRYKLIVSHDNIKDQTFFLSSFSEKQLSKFLFPLCMHNKSDIRNFMRNENIDNYNKRETRGLCLYGNVNMHMMLKYYFLGGYSKTGEKAIQVSAKDKPVDQVSQQVINTPDQVNQQVAKAPDQVSQQVAKTPDQVSQQVAKTPDQVSQQVAKTPEQVSQQVAKTPDQVSQQVINTPDQVSQQVINTPDFFTFKEKYISLFKLNYVNYIINVDEGIVIDRNNDIHLYAIGQNKHITNFIHDIYNERIKKKKKNFFSSCQWTVVYKKMIKKENNKVVENFIYVTRDYTDKMFTRIRRKCKLSKVKWIEGELPMCLEKQKRGGKEEGKRETADQEMEKDEERMQKVEDKTQDKIIFVKVRNNEKIKKAKIMFTSDHSVYLKLQHKDAGLSPGQMITFYFPFIIKKKGRGTKYIYSLKKYAHRPIYYHCIGTSKISNQYLDVNLYQRIMKIHRDNNLTIF